jgi:hypothetical protein
MRDALLLELNARARQEAPQADGKAIKRLRIVDAHLERSNLRWLRGFPMEEFRCATTAFTVLNRDLPKLAIS